MPSVQHTETDFMTFPVPTSLWPTYLKFVDVAVHMMKKDESTRKANFTDTETQLLKYLQTTVSEYEQNPPPQLGKK